jgi:hypothetical protein
MRTRHGVEASRGASPARECQLFGATTAIYDNANIQSVAGSAAATVGWGLWLDGLASISAVVALLVVAWAGRSEKVAPTPYEATPVDGELVRN